MSQLSPYNMQLFCRICLDALRPAIEIIYNIHLVPNLTEVILACTTLDVKEDADFYPKNMCQLCYEKLEDFRSFRSAALRSNEVLHGITREKRKAIAETDNSSQNNSKKTKQPEENNDDPLALRSKLAVRGITRQKRISVCEKIKPIAETNNESQRHLKEKQNSEEDDDNPSIMVSKRVLRGITRQKRISVCEKIKPIAETDNESQNHLKEKENSEEDDDNPSIMVSKRVLRGITRQKRISVCEKIKPIAETDNESQNHLKEKQNSEEDDDNPSIMVSKRVLRGITRQKRISVCEKIKPIAETDNESQNHLKEKQNSEKNDDNPLIMVSKRVLRGITSKKNSGLEKIKPITEKDNESQNHSKEKPKGEVNDDDSLALRSKRVLRSITREKRNSVCEKIKPIAETDNEFQSHLQKTQEPEENYNDELIIPELSTDLFKKSIKSESEDFEGQGQEENQTNVIYIENPDEIKNYLDSENEENTEFYENNALGTNYHSTEDENVEEKDKGKKEREAKKRKSSIQHTTSSERLASRRNRSKKSLKCPRCDKQVYKQVYLDAHIRGVHEGHKKPFLCKKCCKSFTRYNKLREHIQLVHLKTKFACDFEGCGAVFNLRTTLKTHRKVVHSTDPTLPFSLDLQKILELHQAELNTEMEIDNICQLCVKKFSSKRALTEHLKRHANIKEHICKVCGAAKVTRTELLTHMRTHDPNTEKFKCTVCPQEFNHKNAIQRHIRTVHEGLRPFSCSYCSKRFATRNSKVFHERRHTGERPFVCEICRKGFVQQDALKGHMKNHDKSLRTHVCKYCSRRFITRKNLIDHEARHRGDKPHICEICNHGFFIREDLIYHRSSHVNANEDFSNDVADNGSSHSSM